MDKSTIPVFLTVAEECSFRKAAEKLGYTQAGISYIIHNLESELGLTLFLRGRKGVTLSPEGEALLPYIKQLDADNRALKQAVNELRGLEQGSLRVVAFYSVSINWLPGIIQKFKKDYPGINIEVISEEDNLLVEKMVLTGEADCGFFLTDVKSEIETYKLKEEKILAVVSPDHELVPSGIFPVARLGEFPYIEMKFDTHTGIMNIFKKYGVTPNSAYHLDNDSAALAMASKGLGFCVYPELLTQNVAYDIRCLEFDEPQKRTISLGTRSTKTASKACLKFMEYVREWVEENG